MSNRPRASNVRALAVPGLVALLALTTGCSAALVAGGVFAVGIGASAFAFGCDEGVGVEVRDGSSSHPVCDVEVVAASSEGKVVHFSPCFQAYLGNGTWTITASKPGFTTATGSVEITKDHRCGTPLYHSVELTLAPVAESRVDGNSQPSTAPAVASPPAPVTSPAEQTAGAATSRASASVPVSNPSTPEEAAGH